MLKILKKWESTFFPEREIFNNKISTIKQLILFVILFILFSLFGIIFRPGGLIGFDWIHFYGQDIVPPFYPPWTKNVIEPLTWSLLIGLTLASFSLAALKRSVHPVSIAVTFFSLPLLWTIFLGQLEGIVLLGLLGISWLVPLALVKPQVSIFAFGATRKYFLVAILFLLFSLLVWGFWPINTLNVESFYAEGRYPQNIGLGLWGLPIALAAIWFSRGDMDMLMLGGVFLLPHLIPYNLLPVIPAIARLKPWAAIVAVLLSWLPMLANWIGSSGWWFGWFFILFCWTYLAMDRYFYTPFVQQIVKRFSYFFGKK